MTKFLHKMSATHRTLPICSLASLPEWFLQVEQEFLLRNITAQTTKFRMLVTELLLTVGDLLNDQQYATYKLKEAILRRAAPNPLTALSSFLSSDTTDNRTPTETLRHFQRRALPLSQTAARRYTANPAGIRRSIRAACSESRRDHRSENKRTYSSNSVCHNCYPLRNIGIPYSLGRCTVQGCTEIIHMGAFTLPASLRTPSPLRRERNFWRPAPSRHRFRTPPACRNWNDRRSPTPRRRQDDQSSAPIS